MAEPLKYWYNPDFFEHLCKVIKKIIPDFNDTLFIHTVFDNEWPDLELKQRTRKVTLALNKILPKDYDLAIDLIVKISNAYLEESYDKPRYPLIFLPDYVELYGINQFEKSMQAIEQLTQLISAEFAIRPFIVKYPKQTMSQMKRWSKHENHHVRRLSSEGCRPRLPWAMGLPAFKKDATPILPILENLKMDNSEFVRRSVANNLNDIAKDNPDLVLKIAGEWKNISNETDWILKHGSRTLLKQGHNSAFSFHGFDPKLKIKVSNLQFKNPKIKIGDIGEFSFSVINQEKKNSSIHIAYAITFITASGNNSRKVFKVSEKELKPGEQLAITRKQRFTNFTTRKHFPGNHILEIILNGKSKESLAFDLI